MKVVFAIDSMKGSLSSMECGKAAAQGLLRAIPDAEYEVRPLADGGEGTVQAVTTGCGGTFREANVMNPLGKRIRATYGIIENPNKTAIIEISAAAGLTLIPDVDRDPFKTTTYGVGELILDAIEQGCRHFIIGLGGSATNDAGIGMLQALGVKFYDSSRILTGDNGYLTGGDLEFISRMSPDSFNPVLSECTFRIACDVDNPLFGPRGASRIFGPQKGLFDSEIDAADKWMRNFAKLSKESLHRDVDPDVPGCGAAGGLGFAFKYFLGGNLEPGNKIVIDETNLKNYISDADIVVTGEGMLDAQTAMGKAPIGIAHIAKVFNKPVIALVGSVAASFDGDSLPDVDAYFPIMRRPVSLEQAMDPATAKVNIAATAEQIFRLLQIQTKI
ncbi:MAG: glycerate kinase [Eubacterium sp.]|nr:glycerate kinase [Eubacterium sp.]